jgi:hypothetical protein
MRAGTPLAKKVLPAFCAPLGTNVPNDSNPRVENRKFANLLTRKLSGRDSCQVGTGQLLAVPRLSPCSNTKMTCPF